MVVQKIYSHTRGELYETQGTFRQFSLAMLIDKQSSLLLQSILQVCSQDHNTLTQVGWLCIEQLTLLRHRGAFSTVAQTFALCCDHARRSQDSSTQQLNDAWYNVRYCYLSSVTPTYLRSPRQPCTRSKTSQQS